MQITTLSLCDAVSVREGLLHTLGAGITILQRPSFPAPLLADIAVFLSHPNKATNVILTVTVREAGKNESIGTITVVGSYEPAPGMDADTAAGTPFALDARDVGIPKAGNYVLDAAIEGGRGLSYYFSVVEMQRAPA